MLKKILCLLLLTNVVLSYSKYSINIDDSKGQINRAACSYALRSSATFCTGTALRTCVCTNPYIMASMAGCMNMGHPIENPEKYYIYFCKNWDVTITEEMYLAAYENYTKYAVYTSEIENFNKSIPIQVPIKLTEAFIHKYRKGYNHSMGNLRISLYYGSGMLAYWAFIMVIFGVSHWAKFFCPSLVKTFSGPVSNFWRKYFILPALGRKNKTKDVSWLKIVNFLAPSRIETIVIVGFCAVTIFCNAHNISYFEGDPIITTRAVALNRYVGDRSGITCTMLIPIVILFSGRNNFLQWLTGINFATFITYHKWVARVMFTLIVVHAATYTKVDILLGSLTESYKYKYMQQGAVATVAGGIIWVQSILYLRRKWYEMFLLVHISMAALFIAGTWYHVIDLGYLEFMYASIACWSFDRAVRIARLLHFGFPKATVTLLQNDTLKIIVRRPHFWPAVPGGHAFIHFIRPSCFWQSHPFTFTVSPDSSEYIVMYCKIKGGITHGLYQYLQTFPEKSTQIRVTLEGPYGEPTPARAYDSAVFIAGGNGIPGIYSEAIDLAYSRFTQRSEKATKLYWIIKDYTSLFWFYDELLELKKTGLQCTIYVSQPTSLTDFKQFESFDDKEHERDSSEEDEVKKIELEDFDAVQEAKFDLVKRIRKGLSHVTFKEGRPNLTDLVKAEIELSSGSVAFVACGPPVMVDEVRYSCVQSLLGSQRKRVDYFEQLQIWT